MSKAVLNKTAFSLKILVLLGILFLSKFAKDQKAEFDHQEKQNFTVSTNELQSPRVLPPHVTHPLPLSY